MTTSKSRKENLEWQLPYTEPFKISAAKFEHIVKSLPRKLLLKPEAMRNLKSQIEMARGSARQMAKMRFVQPSALRERLIEISQKTQDLISVISSRLPERRSPIVIAGASFSPNKNPVFLDSVMSELAKVAASELGHEPSNLQEILNLDTPAPTYVHIQGILDDLIKLKGWADKAEVNCKAQKGKNNPQSRNADRNWFLREIARIWDELVSTHVKLKQKKRDMSIEDFTPFAIKAAGAFGWNCSEKVIHQTVKTLNRSWPTDSKDQLVARYDWLR